MAILVGLCCIGVGLYFGFIQKSKVGQAGPKVRILPGIEVVFTRDENAADYYAKACESMRLRAKDDRDLKSLTSDERKWFMLGTSCRRSSWYPEHSAHITDPMDTLPQLQYLRGLGRIMAEEGRSTEREGDAEKAMDIWKRVAVLGWHTESEQECALEALVGIAVQQIAYNEFIRHYREDGNEDTAKQYETFKEQLRLRAFEFKGLTGSGNREDYNRLKRIALSHESPLWRKEACMGFAYHCAEAGPSARQEAASILRTVSLQDRDPLVRETARNMIPYILGQKPLPE